MRRITTVQELREALAPHRASATRIALVPTMGALHEGHLALVRLAAEHADVVVVTVFVNPGQFDRPDDLAAYPRDLEGDEAALERLGDAAPDVVFAPEPDEVDPRPPLTTVHVASITNQLCGAGRPGHFDAVATMVLKLLNFAQPDVAVFGRKDFQQLAMIRRLVADLHLDVEILAGPTVREDDGLALSSRNRRLTPDQRRAARALSASLAAAVDTARRRPAGAGFDTPAIRDAALAVLRDESGVELEYLELVDPGTLQPPGTEPVPARLLVAVAAHVGAVRLIDNVVLGEHDDEDRLLRRVRAGGDDRERHG